jgi:hypothetical protein
MRRGESGEVGSDALDARVPRAPLSATLRAVLPARRAALGVGATAAPSLMFILVGAALGPELLNVLSPRVLLHLDAVVSVALAALGIFVGLELGALTRSGGARPLLLAATTEATITIGVVTAAMFVLLSRWGLPLPMEPGLVAGILGISSCASAAVRFDGPVTPDLAFASRVADIEDVPLIALGAVVVAMASGSLPVVANLLAAIAAGAAVGLAGVLLFERAAGAAERGVFVAGSVVLLGGVAAFLEASPLLTGATAAVVWVRMRGAADQLVRADLRKLQHPLVALLLIVAGASIQLTTAALWIAAPLVLFRLTGKLLASSATAAIARVPAGVLGTVLAPPGIVGVALALNVQQVAGAGETTLVSSVTTAAVASEILAAALLPRSGEAA